MLNNLSYNSLYKITPIIDNEFADDKQNNNERYLFFKALNDIVTKFISTEFLPFEFGNLEKILTKFITTYTQHINEYKRARKLNDNDVIFLYKGGNVIRIVTIQNLNTIINLCRHDLKNKFSDIYKISDIDCSIFININLPEYEKIYEELTVLSLNVINLLKNEINKNPEKYFYFENQNQIYQEQKLYDLFSELNKQITEYNLSHDIKYASSLVTLIYGDHIIKSDQNTSLNYDNNQLKNPEQFYEQLKMGSKRNDILVLKNASTNKIETYDGYENNYTVYSSINTSINEMVNNHVQRFNLTRLKINMLGIFEIKDINGFSTIFIKNVPGELLDVSISHRNSYDMQLYKTHSINDYIRTYIFSDDITFSFISYNLDGLIHDLIHILYVNNIYPWNDLKYVKRLKRLILLLLFKILASDVNITKGKLIEILDAYLQFMNDMKEFIHDRKSILDSKLDFIEYNKKLSEKIKPIYKERDNYIKYCNSVIEIFSLIKDIFNKNVDKLTLPIIKDTIVFMGGNGLNEIHYKKYLKYKHKYLQLK